MVSYRSRNSVRDQTEGPQFRNLLILLKIASCPCDRPCYPLFGPKFAAPSINVCFRN